ncbi:MAG: hypothetical protein JNM67_08955 [Bacteroidetes bacterium]|nr:hypothetical protein [Bacteroidota bacterium]
MIQAIKGILPKQFKQFLWFVFKSPQRKWKELGYSTLMTDIKGWISTRRTPKKLKKITICIGIKNRSVNLIDFVITSANLCDHKDLIAFSIFDCGSDDTENLEQSIRSLWKGEFTFQSENIQFARSIAFNRAVKSADDGLILVCDADMSLPKDIVFKVNKFASRHSAWFPHVWFTNEDGSGRYYTESTGMMACYKSDFIKAGQLDETIKDWGKEDWLLFFAFYKIGKACIRSNEPNFVHHYHKSLKPEHFKPLF